MENVEKTENAPLTIEQLEAELGPPKTEYPIKLKSGHTLRVRVINNATEKVLLGRKATANYVQATAKPDPEWQPFLPQTEEVIKVCTFISELLIEPQVSFTKALDWAKNRASLLQEIAEKITSQAEVAFVETELEAIETEKNA